MSMLITFFIVTLIEKKLKKINNYSHRVNSVEFVPNKLKFSDFLTLFVSQLLYFPVHNIELILNYYFLSSKLRLWLIWSMCVAFRLC